MDVGISPINMDDFIEEVNNVEQVAHKRKDKYLLWTFASSCFGAIKQPGYSEFIVK